MSTDLCLQMPACLHLTQESEVDSQLISEAEGISGHPLHTVGWKCVGGIIYTILGDQFENHVWGFCKGHMQDNGHSYCIVSKQVKPLSLQTCGELLNLMSKER